MVYKNNIGLYQYQLERLSIEKKKEKEKKMFTIFESMCTDKTITKSFGL